MSELTIKYFGVVAEVTDKAEEVISIHEEEISIGDLVKKCLNKYPGLDNVSFKVAHNQKISDSGMVRAADEIALLPPFSGG